MDGARKSCEKDREQFRAHLSFNESVRNVSEVELIVKLSPEIVENTEKKREWVVRETWSLPEKL